MAGTLRAEATLAAANLIYLVLLVLGGVIFPLTDFSSGVRHVLELLPISALSNGLRVVLVSGGTGAAARLGHPGGLDRRGFGSRRPLVPLGLGANVKGNCAHYQGSLAVRPVTSDSSASAGAAAVWDP